MEKKRTGVALRVEQYDDEGELARVFTWNRETLMLGRLDCRKNHTLHILCPDESEALKYIRLFVDHENTWGWAERQ